MERYAAVNEYDEVVSKWFATEAEARLAADVFTNSSFTPFLPSLAMSMAFSKWAKGKPLTILAGECWDGAYPVVYRYECRAWILTGKIVSAQDEKYTVTECGTAVYGPSLEVKASQELNHDLNQSLRKVNVLSPQ